MTTRADIEHWLASTSFAEEPRGRLRPGDCVGAWRVMAYLGRGLSAEVYRVVNVRFNNEGALKLLVDGSRGLRERFLAEADALRFLKLKELPLFLEAGDWQGAPYYVMELLQPIPDPFPRARVAPFMNRVAKAVQRLHEAGYVHRDLKPGNILCRANGEPVLIDLGLVKRRGTGVSVPIVRHGRDLSIIDGKPVGVGTLDFAAPEQLLKGEFSVQSDIFSLGKVLLALYLGRAPYLVKPILRRATREQPNDRYATANDFAAALRHRRFPVVLAFLGAVALAALVWFLPGLSVVMPSAPMPAPTPLPAEFYQRQTNETDSVFFARILPAAERGDPVTQLGVAEAHFYGRGVPTNRTEAVRWYRRAAEQGEPAAQASLGLCLFRGWGCPRDREEAATWYRRGAEHGDLAAMNDLAFAYLHGIGVEKAPSLGFDWAMKAAQRGSAPAQTLVGECYLYGRGVERDLTNGEKWLYRAARQGNRRAMNILENK